MTDPSKKIIKFSPREATVTLPERLELEYMLDQRRLAQGNGSLNESRLRLRLWKLAHDVAEHSRAQVAGVLGKPVPLPRSEILADWVEGQVEATKAFLEELRSEDRQDAEGIGEEFFRKMLRGTRESKASYAVLALNAELIEEVARGGGSSHYRWITQKDDRVRPNHAKLDDKIIAWSKEPSGGGTRPGDKGHPGSGYGCRCYPIPFRGDMPTRKPRRQKAVAVAVTKKAKAKPVKSREIDTGYKGRLKSDMTLEQAEDTIRSIKSHEQAMLWDTSGNPLMRKKGLKGKVPFTAKEVAYLQEHPNVFTHNHPNGMAVLSGGDIEYAFVMNTRITRCVTASGRGMEMRVTNIKKFNQARRNQWAISADIRRIEKQIARTGKAKTEAILNAVSPAEYNANSAAINARVEAVWEATARDEALRLYGQLGKKHGFAITGF